MNKIALILLFLTCASYCIIEVSPGLFNMISASYVYVVLLLVSLFKIRLIFLFYMGIIFEPVAVKLLFLAWLLTTGALLLVKV